MLYMTMTSTQEVEVPAENKECNERFGFLFK